MRDLAEQVTPPFVSNRLSPTSVPSQDPASRPPLGPFGALLQKYRHPKTSHRDVFSAQDDSEGHQTTHDITLLRRGGRRIYIA